MLSVLGLRGIRIFHMNEVHSSLLTLALLERRMAGPRRPPTREGFNVVRKQCVFTTPTPVSAGHDRFSPGLVRQVLGEERSSACSTRRSAGMKAF
jgi:starch phosphorylase